ncbi:uncharacterized protein N7469_005852 [Penicillium citrinum]|uniref:Membrane anchor Opy2 N-terminal domain-containing protein n=2 Tax=Penicillium TaxID=5073 RepID=A0A9W9P2G6_PENCI|nr:uncharacterized protein N7469_005852 [Penicillium citrinum]KAJ5234086.1 hypothetical protein N7469_005852 [Penicillium citrinum]KAJ5572433.1 hypothetical protein N7450_009417 [Penicillium hetheringtonii]
MLDSLDLSSSPLAGFSPANSLFKRCKSCGPAPSCPSCPSGQICTMTSQTCDTCSETKCIDNGSSSSAPSDSGGGTNVGAIAGGVVGGVAAIAILLFLIWWFVIRKRRNQDGAEKNNNFAAARDERKSTNSIASTVLTRASNVIQIAYIPGVTNRSPPETPASLVPPVPPLPGAAPDQHFFMPGDLRDSSWTTTTGHQSISPTLRSSVATTIYRNDAIVSAVPAQQISRSRANIVSVHNTSPDQDNSTPTQPVPVMITPKDAPAVPAITQSQLAKAEAMKGNSSIVARQVVAKPVMVRGASVKKKDSQGSPDDSSKKEHLTSAAAGSGANSQSFDHQTSTFDNSSDEEDEEDTRPSSPSHSTVAKTATTSEEPSRGNGPFHDQAGAETESLSPRRTPPPRVQSPFSDANEVK